MNETVCFMPAHELATLIRERQVSIEDVVTQHLGRIERRNPAIGAYVHVLADEALASAASLQRQLDTAGPRGALHGLPLAIKDLDDVAGVPTTCGSRAMANQVAVEDAVFTQRLRAAGAIILGKTNTPEFGHKATTDNLLFGPASSPFRVGTNAGGSSGGSAAAVADGMAALAQGGDGGGSIRIPASLCGIYGLKPSWGRVPHVYRPGGFLFTPFVSDGPLTRTVQDAALMLDVMVGPDPRDPLSLPNEGLDFASACHRTIEGLRVAYSSNMGVFPVDPRVTAVVEGALQGFRDAGATVEEVDPRINYTQQELTAVWRRGIAVQYAQMVAGFKAEGIDLLALGSDGLEPELLKALENADRISALEYKLDDMIRTHVFDAIQDIFATYDLLVSPTVAVPYVKNATDGLTVGPNQVNGETVDPLLGWCLTYLLNFTGHPAASLPAGLDAEGSPVGMQIVGPRLRDDVVLAASAAVEHVRPWAHTYPGLRDPGDKVAA